ncbi:non-ribosomal peptide synthetase [Burkholderia ubonensis]|uniref:non-ribosomal peptide synthetase n=1 Tax=Burkholderia ubonensis TaxID=101571 RepID=UPI00075CBE4E|nr:non-ribosomal peptide synthetase [Burkholderia ubonensis]KWC52008.1 non-ribosomal peptide synthetase [Burkholderia ubonensis]
MSELNLNTLSTSGQYQEHLAFWNDALGRIDEDFRLQQAWQAYALPLGPAPVHAFELDGDAARVLEKLAAGNELGAFVVLLAALFRVLGRYDATAGLFVDSPRLIAESAAASAGPVPLIGAARPGATVREYLNQVRDTVQRSYTYQDFPIAALAHRLHGETRATNVAVRFDGLHEAWASADYDLSIEIRHRARYEIVLTGRPTVFTLHYLQHVARHLRNLLAGFDALDAPLDTVSLLDDEERARLRAHAEPVAVQGTFLEQFAQRAASAPDSIAVATAEASLTYAELDDQSSRLASFLLAEYAIERGDVVGVVADRSERWIVGMLGVLKAGAVYLPLDPEFPQERLRFMIEDAKVKALLTHSEHLPLLADFWAIPMFALDFQLDTLAPASASAQVEVRPDDAAYIIYTSGSTGAPKGVVLEHAGLLNMAQYHVDAFGFDADDRFVQFYSPGFDGSIMEIFVTLLAGARLVLAKTSVIRDAPRFVEYIAQQGVTTINATPAYLAALDWDALGAVKRVISAGDNARVADLCKLARTRSCHNSYGPTEATVCITDYVVDAATAYGARLPVGRPIRNAHLYLLDEHGALAPEGCTGEICVSGIALARGYVGRDDLTAAAFVAHPFEPGERLYRTGDLGVWLPDGNLEITGRRDTQVKIRGYRIETGEIEAVLRQHAGVADALVFVREDASKHKHLVACVETATASVASLREHLQARLPEFMVPASIVTLERMPLTPNGKPDRKALAALELAPAPSETVYSAPTNDVEARLGKIWCDVLGREQIGIRDNFFELGGDSILLIQVMSLAQQVGLKFTADQFFAHPTIAELARVAVDAPSMTIPQEPVVGPAPLTPIQHWFFAQDVADPHHYNQSTMIEVPASLRPDVIEQALSAVATHHDALRLSFERVAGAWRQSHAAPPLAIPLGVTSLAGEAPAGGQAAMLATATRMQESFTLSAPPLLRAHLFQFGPDAPQRLLVVAHHLVIDGVSWRILFEDLYTACRQLEAGEAVRLPARTTAWRDWANRLAELGATRLDGLDYWLQGNAEAQACFDDMPVGTVAEAGSTVVEFDAQQTQALLQDVPRAFNTQINEVLLTALLLAFGDWTGNASLAVDLEGHGREDIFDGVDTSRTIGWFTSHYPVFLNAGDAAVAADALRNVKEQLRAVPMRGLGYGIARYLGKDARIAAALERQPPAPVRFNYLGQIDRVLADDTGWKPVLDFQSPEHSPRARRGHLFEIDGVVFDGRLRLTWHYNREACAPGVIERLTQCYRSRLLSIVAASGDGQPGLSPSDFPAARISQEALDALVSRIKS